MPPKPKVSGGNGQASGNQQTSNPNDLNRQGNEQAGHQPNTSSSVKHFPDFSVQDMEQHITQVIMNSETLAASWARSSFTGKFVLDSTPSKVNATFEREFSSATPTQKSFALIWFRTQVLAEETRVPNSIDKDTLNLWASYNSQLPPLQGGQVHGGGDRQHLPPPPGYSNFASLAAGWTPIPSTKPKDFAFGRPSPISLIGQFNSPSQLVAHPGQHFPGHESSNFVQPGRSL
jgi:hypothetical protein